MYLKGKFHALLATKESILPGRWSSNLFVGCKSQSTNPGEGKDDVDDLPNQGSVSVEPLLNNSHWHQLSKQQNAVTSISLFLPKYS